MNDLREKIRDAVRIGRLPSPLIVECAHLYLSGKSFPQIAAIKNIPQDSIATVRRMVKRTVDDWPKPKEIAATPGDFARELAEEPRSYDHSYDETEKKMAWWRANRHRLLPPAKGRLSKGPVFGAAAVPTGERLSGMATQPAVAVAPHERLVRTGGLPLRTLEAEIHIPPATLLKADDVARLLNISSQTLANWRATGRHTDRLPFVKLGGAVRYRSEDVARVQREGIG